MDNSPSLFPSLPGGSRCHWFLASGPREVLRTCTRREVCVFLSLPGPDGERERLFPSRFLTGFKRFRISSLGISVF